MVDYPMDSTYTFDVESLTGGKYRITKKIIQWLQSTLSSLTDSNNETLFSKVNLGYNESTIKGFGKKPVCDVYLSNVDYTTDFTSNRPESIKSVIICYLKGNMNNTYLKACELCDYLLQEFEENDDLRVLIEETTVDEETRYTRIVRNTFVSRCELRLIPATKTYGVLVAFELEHQI